MVSPFQIPLSPFRHMNRNGFRRVLPDVLFWLQIGLASVFGGSQLLRLLESTVGVSVSWLLVAVIFAICNLILALRAHARQPLRVTNQTVIIYVVWVLWLGADLITLLARSPHWSAVDWWTIGISGTGSALVLLWARLRQPPPHSSIVIAAIAVFARAVPHSTLAWNIARYGGSGLSGPAVIIGNITISLRLFQLAVSGRKSGWDVHKIGSFVSEAAGELTWLMATIVWIVVE